MNQRNVFMSGIADMLVLLILRNEDTYTYDIAKKINALSDDKLNISLNTLYTVIYKLEQEGYISEERIFAGKKRTRIYYHLEPSGVEYSEFLYNEYAKVSDAVQSALHNISIQYDINNRSE